jgi:WD40 repeat protein/class 3 adenylate cyclase
MPELHQPPTGTVTFLFTDIEGSTHLSEQYPRAMQAAVARHDTLLREAIEQHGGYVFKTVGDAFCAAFTTAPQALDAALVAQRYLLSADWESTGPIKVRIALHTGVAEIRNNDYFGQPLNRVARLLSTGHGGQILLSLATQQLVRDHLPSGTSLKDLGEGGLKDLSRAEHVYQVVAPDLPSDFPPLRTFDTGYLEPTADGTRAQNPYKGLRAFQEADAPDFFGREALVERLLGRMAEEGELRRFLAVVGPSGSGKSSVVRAGLVPALRQGRLPGPPGSDRWLVVEMLPGAHPFEELDALLLSVAAKPPATLMGLLREDERGLIRAVKRVLPRDESVELVLVIDQFEEVFTHIEDEPTRVGFLESLCAAVSDPRSRLRVIVTLRADFFDRPLLYPDPGELMRQRTAVVLPLSAEELERAIVEPARGVGVSLEAELLASIIKDVGEQPGSLPLLQYALTELFERRAGKTMTLATYHESGGVVGALSRRADEIYGSFTPDEGEASRQLFLRLVTLGEGVEDTRRRARRSELESLSGPGTVSGTESGDRTALDKVIEAFGRYRLLTFDMDPVTKGPTVEVAHEALIRTWGKLREWLAESRSDLQVQRHLMAAAGEWEGAGRDPSFLASGARLAQYEVLSEAADKPGGIALTREEQEYLRDSIEERGRQEKAERERQERELELARQAAEKAEQAARAQRSAASRLRYLVAGLVLFLVLAIVLSAFALAQSRVAQSSEKQAQDNLQLSEAQRLAAEANNLNSQSGTSDLVALLAIRSLASIYTPQGDVMLQAASRQYYPLKRFPGIAAFPAPDGKRLVGLKFNPKVISAIDIATGKEAYSMPWSTTWNLSPDAKYILTVDTDQTVHTWDIFTGKELYHASRPSSLPDYSAGWGAGQGLIDAGRVLWSSPDGKTAVVWDLAANKELTRLTFSSPPTGNCFSSGCVSPDRKYYVTGHTDGMVRIWDLHSGANGAPVRTLQARGYSDRISSVTFSSDGKLLVAEYDHNPTYPVVIWNAQTGTKMLELPDAGAGTDLVPTSISSDGRYLLTGGNDKAVRLWDLTTGQEVGRFRGHSRGVQGAAFMPGDKQILSLDVDENALLWDVEPKPHYPNFEGIMGAIEQLPGYIVGTSPDGMFVLVLDTQSGKEVHRLPLADSYTWFGSWPGARNFAALVDGTARVWDTQSGKEIARFPVPNGSNLQPSHDDRYVVTGSADGKVELWDVQTGKLVHEFKGFTASIGGEDISADDRYVVAAVGDLTSKDKSIRIWDVHTGQQVQRIAGRDAVHYTVYFTLDGKSVVSLYNDGIGIVWDVRTGREVRRFSIANNAGGFFITSSDMRYLAAVAAGERTASVIDVQTGQEVRRFSTPDRPLKSLGFSVDEKRLLVGSLDGTVWQTDFDYHDTIRYLCAQLRGRDFTDAERAQYSIKDDTPTCPMQ